MTQRYRLKPGRESFQIVDGPFAGRKFERGREYKREEIPPGERARFEEVIAPAPAKKTTEPKKDAGSKKADNQN